MPKIRDAQQAFLLKIQFLYDVEKQLEKTLPKLQKKAKNIQLKEGFSSHLEQTRMHIERLEKVFNILGIPPKKLGSEGIKGIIDDGKWVIDSDAPEDIKDSMLAGAARYAEHYEMAGYMTAILEADALGITEAYVLLSETLKEEEATDKKLAEFIAKNV